MGLGRARELSDDRDLVGGGLIGATMSVRHHVWGIVAGTAAGAAAGCIYVWVLPRLLRSSLVSGDSITASIVACGVIGGLARSLLLRRIRRGCRWWTRWEERA